MGPYRRLCKHVSRRILTKLIHRSLLGLNIFSAGDSITSVNHGGPVLTPMILFTLGHDIAVAELRIPPYRMLDRSNATFLNSSFVSASATASHQHTQCLSTASSFLVNFTPRMTNQQLQRLSPRFICLSRHSMLSCCSSTSTRKITMLEDRDAMIL